MNSKMTPITIVTDREALVVIQSDTLRTKHNRITDSVFRSKQPLEINVITDSLQRKYLVASQNSPAYWANIICNYGVGMIVDEKNIKRYGYPRYVYLGTNDSMNKYYRYVPPNPSKNYILISIPHVNSFLAKPDNVTKARTKTGFFGVALSWDHYYQRNKFFRLSIGAVASFPIPFPAPYDYKGDFETMHSEYLNLTNNYQLGRFLLGYGLSIAKNSWRHFNNFPYPVVYYGSQDDAAVGVVLQSYYKLGRVFYIGAIYRPTFIRFPSNRTLQYEHLISIDLNWRIRL
jgi:hypothetical protein